MGYIIATDHRNIEGKVVFMVDPAVNPDHHWTAKAECARVFKHSAAAQAIAGRLKFNNPRVINEEAAAILSAANPAKINVL
jgi:hypothetical protein